MAAEAVLAIGAGIAARSVLLTAFGFDSVIELLSGVTLLWRLSSEARGAGTPRMESIERRATVISAALLVLLSAYLVLVGLGGLVARLHPAGSALGVAVAAAAVLVMPVLAWRKRRANSVLGSAALRADIAETITCAYMAAATLAGAGLNLLFGLWWAEYAAAIALLVFIVIEAREAVEAARGGHLEDQAGTGPV
jgi:divalent metal cation (Fe/Co/Zn/Cd) transporter